MKSAAANTMEDFPPEIYPLFIPEPAAAAAMRCVSGSLHTKIPRDLFKNTAFTELLARWESPRYYVEVVVKVEPDKYAVTVADGILGGVPAASPADPTPIEFGKKYVLTIFNKFISLDTIGWWWYVDELRQGIYKLHKLGGGGKLKPAEFLEKLPASNVRTGAVWFSEPVKRQNANIGLFTGVFADLAPLIDSECVVALYTHIDFTPPPPATFCDKNGGRGECYTCVTRAQT